VDTAFPMSAASPPRPCLLSSHSSAYLFRQVQWHLGLVYPLAHVIPTQVRWAVALALLGLCTVPVSGEGDVLEFDAYRMVQYDRNGEELGSRSAALSNLAVPAGGKGNLGRKAVVLDFDKVTSSLLYYSRA